MGCGGSRLGGTTVKADEGGVVPLPAGIRPLLRRRLEEMKKRSHAGVLKGNQTLSKKELLRHGSSEDGEETEENDGSLKSSAKVAPAPDHNVEEKKEVIYEKVTTRDDVGEVKKQEEEEVVTKQEKDHHHHHHHDQEVMKKQEEDHHHHHDQEVVKKQEEEDHHHHHDQEVVKKQEDKNHHGDDVDDVAINGVNHDDIEGRMSNFDERMIGPGSPSFRIYCIDVPSSDDDEEKDGEDTRKSMETESVITEPKEEESIVKKEKRERKGKRFGITLPRKYLSNVTAPCYAGGGCMGNTHSRLVQEKPRQ